MAGTFRYNANKYICALTCGSSLQKLTLASSKINPSIHQLPSNLVWKLYLLRRFITTRMIKFHLFLRILSCSNMSINFLSFRVQFMSVSYPFHFVSCRLLSKSPNPKTTRWFWYKNLFLEKECIKASSQFRKWVPHRSPKT